MSNRLHVCSVRRKGGDAKLLLTENNAEDDTAQQRVRGSHQLKPPILGVTKDLQQKRRELALRHGCVHNQNNVICFKTTNLCLFYVVFFIRLNVSP